VRRLREGHSARNVCLAICKLAGADAYTIRTSQLHETRGNVDLKATCLVPWNRNDPSGRGISRLEKVTLKATAANAARIHDRGDTTAPVRSLPPPCTYEENFLIILAGAAGNVPEMRPFVPLVPLDPLLAATAAVTPFCSCIDTWSSIEHSCRTETSDAPAVV